MRTMANLLQYGSASGAARPGEGARGPESGSSPAAGSTTKVAPWSRRCQGAWTWLPSTSIAAPSTNGRSGKRWAACSATPRAHHAGAVLSDDPIRRDHDPLSGRVVIPEIARRLDHAVALLALSVSASRSRALARHSGTIRRHRHPAPRPTHRPRATGPGARRGGPAPGTMTAYSRSPTRVGLVRPQPI